MIFVNLPMGQLGTQIESSRYKLISLHAVQSSVVGPVQVAQGSVQANKNKELFIRDQKISDYVTITFCIS